MSLAEMRMLKWTSEVIREDRIRNGCVRDSFGIVFNNGQDDR